MKDFESQQAIHQYLLENPGNSIVNRHSGNTIGYVNGTLIDIISHKHIECTFYNYKSYEKNIPWYVNMPEGGALCWVWDEGNNPRTSIAHITKIQPEFAQGFFANDTTYWLRAEPIKLEELTNFIVP